MSAQYHDPAISEDAADTVDVVTEVRREAALPKTGALQNAIFNSANFSSIPAVVSVTALRDAQGETGDGRDVALTRW
jgi:hypothetical protein